MKFIKYPSLTNYYAVLKDQTLMSILDKVVGISEKIHGSNVSIVFNREGEMAMAKRTGFITEDDKQFKGLVAFATENKEKLWSIAQLYFADKPEAEQVHLYGELYGAGVQAMEYQENKDKKTAVRFFNVLVSTPDQLIKTDTNVLLERIPTEWVVPIKGTGVLRELISNMDNVNPQSQLGGPSEGDVYQPIEEYVILSGHFLGIKHKRPEFTEKKEVNVKVKEPLSPEAIEALTEARSRVTPQRVDNVLSHGELELDTKNFGPIIKAVQNDIIAEIQREAPQLDADLVKRYVAKVGGDIAKVLREKMADGLETL